MLDLGFVQLTKKMPIQRVLFAAAERPLSGTSVAVTRGLKIISDNPHDLREACRQCICVQKLFWRVAGQALRRIMVYGDNEYFFEGMDSKKSYYFQIEAMNESGVSPRSAVVKVD